MDVQVVVESIQKLIIVHYLNDFSMEQSFDDIQQMLGTTFTNLAEKHETEFEEIQQIVIEKCGKYASDEYIKSQIEEIYSQCPTEADLLNTLNKFE